MTNLFWVVLISSVMFFFFGIRILASSSDWLSMRFVKVPKEKHKKLRVAASGFAFAASLLALVVCATAVYGARVFMISCALFPLVMLVFISLFKEIVNGFSENYK